MATLAEDLQVKKESLGFHKMIFSEKKIKVGRKLVLLLSQICLWFTQIF